MDRRDQSIMIVGAGLSGPVLAIYLARRGYEIELYERRTDPRKVRPRLGQSINITLCTRGFRALDGIGLSHAVQEIAVPVYGRLIHGIAGVPQYQPYGNDGEALYSVSRSALHLTVLRHAMREHGVTVRFNQRCVGLDLSTMTVLFENPLTGSQTRRRAGRIIGADGAHSFLRDQLRAAACLEVCEKQAGHANKELTILPETGGWAEQRNVLHIWPRGEVMLIAFPNSDRSFTCTLNLPLTGMPSFQSLRTDEALRELFTKDFADALALMHDLEHQYRSRPAIPMTSVRCSRWSLEDKVLLVGDAAHAFWPSYGQGANAAFEDCAVLAQCVERHADDWRAVFKDFEGRRRRNTDAITWLSEKHFLELRRHLNNRRFLLRKRIERKLSEIGGESFNPLYNMISFTDMPYVDALRIERSQRRLVGRVLAIADIEAKLDTPDVENLVARWMAERFKAKRGAGEKRCPLNSRRHAA